MKRCVQCGSLELVAAAIESERTYGGRRFAVRVPALRCPKCGEAYTAQADEERLELAAAEALAGQGAADGAAFKFMRKALGLRGAELGELLGVAAETVSRWETGQRPVDRAAFALLAGLVADKASGRSDTLERLRAIAEPRPAAEPIPLAVA